MRVAVVTGASRGLGLALAEVLATRGWGLVIDARGGAALERAAEELARHTVVRAVPGDIAAAGHRRRLVAAAAELGGLHAVVNNASLLGPSPQPELGSYPLDVLEEVYRVNVIGPLGLVQEALPMLTEAPGGGRVINITSDAAVEAYPGWGGYGSSKAALEQATAVLAAEHPGLHIYGADPGDLRTQMHQDAFPGEDISDRPLPEVAVPGLLRLLEDDPPLPSGRYRAQELHPVVVS
jgi:NAD(P)-dependent dehydrogenase (short-subunit alcohol dehydrogenase family)